MLYFVVKKKKKIEEAVPSHIWQVYETKGWSQWERENLLYTYLYQARFFHL